MKTAGAARNDPQWKKVKEIIENLKEESTKDVVNTLKRNGFNITVRYVDKHKAKTRGKDICLCCRGNYKKTHSTNRLCDKCNKMDHSEYGVGL